VLPCPAYNNLVLRQLASLSPVQRDERLYVDDA
jgi:hypothetical protein